jgi:DASH complex subunit ASK1
VHVPGEASTTLDNTGALDQSTQYEDEDLTIRQGEDSELLADGADVTSDASFFGAGAMSSTPMPANRTANGASNANASWESSMESPFERLGRRIRDDLVIGEESEGTPSLPSGYDLHAPSEASTSFGHLTAPTTTHGYGQPLLDLSIGSSLPESPLVPPTTATKLQNNSTPRASRRALPTASPHHNPFQSPARDPSNSKWNGIADLRTTPLNIRTARAAYAPADDDDDDDDDALLGFSPPVTMNFTMPVRPPKSQTPVKATARAVVESLLNQSAINDEYDDLGDTPSPKPPTPSRWTMSAVPVPPPGSRDLFGTHSPSGGNDSFDSGSGSDMSAELAQPSQTVPHPLSQQIYHDEGDSFDDDDSFDSNAERDDRPTLSPTTSEAGVIFGHVRDGPRGGRFDLMGPDELLTFHGGKLEDAEIASSPTPMPHGGAFQKR